MVVAYLSGFGKDTGQAGEVITCRASHWLGWQGSNASGSLFRVATAAAKQRTAAHDLFWPDSNGTHPQQAERRKKRKLPPPKLPLSPPGRGGGGGKKSLFPAGLEPATLCV